MNKAANISKPKITNLGSLSKTIWPGKISLSKMLESGEASKELLESLIKNIEKYYVEINNKAKTRCIDGRFDPDYDVDNLGPQVPGGSVGATLAYKLSAGRHNIADTSFTEDSKNLFKVLDKEHIRLGGHRDNHADGISAAGCGAIDKMNQAVELLSDGSYVQSIYDLTKSLLGDDFKEDNFYEALGVATVLNGHSAKYFGDRIKSFSKLEELQKNSTTTLQGNHQECLVVANYVPGTTLAENDLLNDYDGIQVFNYDVWRTLSLADKLFPKLNDEHNKELFITARAMTAVATLMCLTDGSQTLLVRN